MMDFSNGAGASTGSDILPKGLIVWAILSVRAVKTNANTGTRYIDVELTIDEGQPFAKRKFWDKIGDPQHAGNSEGYRQQGLVAVTRILEAGRGAGPANPDGYKIDNYEQLSGLRVAVKVGIEEGKDGYADKNKVVEWLTPNPASQSGHKLYQRLMAGEHNVSAPKAAAQPSNGFGGAAVLTAAGATGGFGSAPAATLAPAASGFGSGATASPAAASAQPGGWLQQAQEGAAVADDDVPL